MDTGAAYAVTVGISRMRLLFVECWDTRGPGMPAAALNPEGELGRFG